MTKILVPTTEAVLTVNKLVCSEGNNPHRCYDPGKVESAIHSAFYPGLYPFAHGGITKVAGALCYYLVKSHAFIDGNKRTAALVAITFLNQNGWDLTYNIDPKKGENALANIIEGCAAGNVSKEELINWFENHKTKLRFIVTNKS